jgi:hypothetical protein
MTKEDVIANVKEKIRRIEHIMDEGDYGCVDIDNWNKWAEQREYQEIILAALNQLDSIDNGLSRCDWCGPGRIGWFSVQFWARSCYGKRKWMSVTQQYKHQVKYCPMCGRKLEVEG